jgi:hypothetical protein
MTVIGQQMYRGIPIDVEAVRRFLYFLHELRLQLINESPCSRFYTAGGRFRHAWLDAWAEEEEIGFPRTSNGLSVLEHATLKKLVALEPRIAPLAALRARLELLDELKITPRSDGRIRPNFWPFKTRTGRNRPQAREYPMLKAKFTRGFILAPPGRSLAVLDFKAQEIYIAAHLSGDHQLMRDLEGDPYLSFAIHAGFAPPGATDETHGDLRNAIKIAMLGLIYGMGERTLASKLSIDIGMAREICTQFRRNYRVLWDWLESVVRVAYGTRHLETPLDWPLFVGPKLDSYTLRNHLIQATGGDILRASCLYAQDAGLNMIYTLHDAIGLEANDDQIKAQADELSRAMAKGSAQVIGVPIPSKIEFINRRYLLKDSAARFFEEITRRLASMPQVG